MRNPLCLIMVSTFILSRFFLLLVGAAGLWFLLAGQMGKFYAAILDLWSILVWNVAGMTGYEGMTKTWDLIQVTIHYFLSGFILG